MVYSLPFSGAVYPVFFSPRLYRIRWCLTIAAGPTVNLLFASAGLFVQFDQEGAARVLWNSWIFANVLMAVFSLVPFQSRRTSSKNDARLFLSILFKSSADIRREVQSVIVNREYLLCAVKARGKNIEDLISRHAQAADDATRLFQLVSRLRMENDPRCVEYLLRFGAHARVDPSLAIQMIDGFLTAQLDLDSYPKDEKLEGLAQRLLKLEDSLTTRGTYGSILVEIGQCAKGKSILEEVLAKASSNGDRVYTNIFLALAEKREGNDARAREYAVEARRIIPDCPALVRVKDLG